MKPHNPINQLLGLLDGKVFPRSFDIRPETAQDYLRYIATRETRMRQPVSPQIITLAEAALAYGQDKLAPLKWEALEVGYKLLSATDEDIGEVLHRALLANLAATKAGAKPLDFSLFVGGIYVMNVDWVQLFAWMVPALDRHLTQESLALARKMFVVLYLEQREKHPRSEFESMPMLALQKMLDLEPPTTPS